VSNLNTGASRCHRAAHHAAGNNDKPVLNWLIFYVHKVASICINDAKLYLALKAPVLHTLRLIAWQPWRHCVTSLHSAHWLASSLKSAARCPVSRCWPSCSIIIAEGTSLSSNIINYCMWLSCAYLIYNHILLEISGSHSNFIGVIYILHYGNEIVSRTGNKEIRHFLTTTNVRKNPLAQTWFHVKIKSFKIILFHFHAEIKLFWDGQPTAAARVWNSLK